MWQRLKEIDWQNMQQGLKPVDIPNLMLAIMSDDYGVREKASEDLVKQMLDGYKVGSDITIVVIPFLIGILTHERTPDRSLITSMLVEVSSGINSGREPFKTRAFQIKQMICSFRDVYASFATENDSSLQEDIQELEEICNQ